MTTRGVVRFVALFALLAGAACGGSETSPSTSAQVDDLTSSTAALQQFPDIIDVAVSAQSDGTYTFEVSVSSPYDSAEQYADAWRIRGPDGSVYGTRELLHDHASEQPFTRTLSGVTIPADVPSVEVQGRDLITGWGGRPSQSNGRRWVEATWRRIVQPLREQCESVMPARYRRQS